MLYRNNLVIYKKQILDIIYLHILCARKYSIQDFFFIGIGKRKICAHGRLCLPCIY